MELTIDQALQRGVAAHKEGNLQDAERLYRTILKAHPNHSDANHNLGVLAVSVNKAEASLPLFEAALKANPRIEQFWLSYIDALIKTERFDAVRQALTDAQQAGVAAAKLQIFEEQLQSELSLGGHTPQQELVSSLECHQDLLLSAIELREVGKYKEAQEWLNDFIEQNPDNAEALSLLSQVLLLDKREAEAEHKLIAAVSINPELPSVLRNQARLLLKQSKAAEALEKAEWGCKKSPEDLESLLVLALCLRANQRDAEALLIVEKVLKAEPNHAEAHANRALIKMREKDIFGALKDAETAVFLKPHLTQMWFLLGSLHYQSGNLSNAIEALRRAHENEPENPVFMTQLGEFLRQDNKADEAITILAKATELAPKDSNAWTNFGVALQQEEKLADAKIAYEKALALNPNLAAIASNLGAMAQDANDWESALRYFEKALEIDPNLAEAHYNLGITLKELGRLDDAEASFTQAIAMKPNYAEAHSNLGITLQELGRLGEAEASYRRAIAERPDFAAAHRNLVTTKKFSFQDEQFLQMEALYQDPTISEEDRCQICFALAKASDDLENVANAFQFYAEGNVLRQRKLAYEKNQDKELFETLKANHPRITAHSLMSEVVDSDHAPIFIVGMPRSGTTLVEQIISSHPKVTGAGELNFVSQFGGRVAVGQTPVDGQVIRTFRQNYLSALERYSEGNCIVTDKLPQNFYFLGLICSFT